jgi:hypothetical protein
VVLVLTVYLGMDCVPFYEVTGKDWVETWSLASADWVC